MDYTHRLSRRISYLVLAVFSLTIIHAPAAYAGLVGTETLIQSQQTEQQRSELKAFLAQDEVRRQLMDWGVDLAEAQARVDRLSPHELQVMADQMQELPAGGNIVGAIVFVFLVLLITDIAGLTDVFPFVKKPYER